MEFFAALLFLCALSSFVFVPRGSMLFVGRRDRFRVRTRAGWSFAGFWPSTSAVLSERPPWQVESGELVRRGVASRFFADGITLRQEPLSLGPQSEISRAGKTVSIDGERVVLARNEAGAARALAYFEWIARSPTANDRESPLAAAFDAKRLETRREEVRSSTRWLRPLLNAYGLVVCVGLPVLAVLLDAELALSLGGPAAVVLHVLAFVLYAIAHRRVWPGEGGRRFENLVEVVLYPPALLRAARNLELDATEGFHPVTVAESILTESEANAFVRAEWLQIASHKGESKGSQVASLEAQAMREMLRLGGVDLERLLAAPSRQDPLAESYCPACLSEYRREGGECRDCATALLPLRP